MLSCESCKASSNRPLDVVNYVWKHATPNEDGNQHVIKTLFLASIFLSSFIYSSLVLSSQLFLLSLSPLAFLLIFYYISQLG